MGRTGLGGEGRGFAGRYVCQALLAVDGGCNGAGGCCVRVADS